MTEVARVVPYERAKKVKDPNAEASEKLRILHQNMMDPNHPLMQRFQETLNQYYTSHINNLDQYIKESNQELVHAAFEHQKELNSLKHAQENLKIKREKVDALNMQVTTKAEKLEKSRKKLDAKTRDYTKAVSEMDKELQKEEDGISKKQEFAREILRLKAVAELVHGQSLNIKSMKGQIEKNKGKNSVINETNNYYISLMTDNINQQSDNIEINRAQSMSMTAEGDELGRKILEADGDLEVIKGEKEQLTCIWNEWINNLAMRNSIGEEVKNLLSHHKATLEHARSDLTKYKGPLLKKEMENNETLSFQCNSTSKERAELTQKFQEHKDKLNMSKEEIRFLDLALTASLDTFAELQRESRTKQAIMGRLIQGLFYLNNKTRELEGYRLDFLSKCTMIDKNSKYIHSMLRSYRDSIRNEELKIAHIENTIGKLTVMAENARIQVEKFRKILDDELRPMQEERLEVYKEMELDDKKFSTVRDKKMNFISYLLYKVAIKEAETGGHEIANLEREIYLIKKIIKQTTIKNSHSVDFWMRQQEEMIHTSRHYNGLLAEVRVVEGKLLIFNDTVRLAERQIELETAENHRRKKVVGDLVNETFLLQNILAREDELNEHLKVEGVVDEFVGVKKLKEVQAGCIAKEMEATAIRRANRELVKAVARGERKLQLWERNFKNMKIAKASIDKLQQKSGGTMQGLKMYLQKQRVTLTTLQRDQEGIMKQQEFRIHSYARVAVKVEVDKALGKTNKDVFEKKKIQLTRKIREVRTKIKNTESENLDLDEETQATRTMVKLAGIRLSEKEELLKDVSSELAKKLGKRFRTAMIIYLKQKAARVRLDAKKASFKLLNNKEHVLENELNKYRNRFIRFLDVVEKLQNLLEDLSKEEIVYFGQIMELLSCASDIENI